MTNVSEDVARLLAGGPPVDADEQAFPLLTVDENGYPHTALLSRAELEPAADRTALFAVVASPGTRANLRRHPHAALLAVDRTVCHHLKLLMVRSLAVGDVLGCVFTVTHHKRDSLGIPLSPLGFRTTAHLAELEHWRLNANVLTTLQRKGPA
ncbi:pyridoxamine 5'-phosphate oxidase family protein [Actinoallomurus rhizosphaericola]|uniref:pyridoxamine 5'-phosphate oxidase family protein n=1 Tax=Actinoallomurus rhizosphaericola TaxID=2952536 RepID=UPI002093FE8D|nr:pyridoxamine 5'-phosphate oxidase family protein [Actinoallomurus rhizosphaericola]MCO6000330.1 pyridoxamine 5'-phosphate oxidase family protein [Actinoallomurus rhizosphaericola]